MDPEAEYNNRARVAGSADIIAGWAARAARFRLRCPPEPIAYGPGRREAMDLFLPAGGTPRGAVLLLHGGYWQALGREWASHWAAGLLAHGVAVGVPSHDLCPEVQLARVAEQAGAAAAMLRARLGTKLGTNLGTKLVAMGHSAGGHSAAVLLSRMPEVTAAVAISGVFELEPLLRTSINAALRLDAAAARALSPASWPAPGKPFHAVAGGEESGEFIRQGRDMAARWHGSFEILPGRDHLSIMTALEDPAHPLVRRAAALAWQGCGTV